MRNMAAYVQTDNITWGKHAISVSKVCYNKFHFILLAIRKSKWKV